MWDILVFELGKSWANQNEFYHPGDGIIDLTINFGIVFQNIKQ